MCVRKFFSKATVVVQDVFPPRGIHMLPGPWTPDGGHPCQRVGKGARMVGWLPLSLGLVVVHVSSRAISSCGQSLAVFMGYAWTHRNWRCNHRELWRLRRHALPLVYLHMWRQRGTERPAHQFWISFCAPISIRLHAGMLPIEYDAITRCASG